MSQQEQQQSQRRVLSLTDNTLSQKDSIKLADAILLVYDVTSKKSFETVSRLINTIHTIHKDMQTQRSSLPVIAIIGNKNDLSDEQEVSIEEADELAANTPDVCCFKQPCTFETSVTQSDSQLVLSDVFNYILESLIEKDGKKQSRSLNRSRSASAMIATHRASMRIYSAIQGLGRTSVRVASPNTYGESSGGEISTDSLDSPSPRSPRNHFSQSTDPNYVEPLKSPRSKGFASKLKSLVKKAK
jgi:hypothetical protein